MIGKIMKAASFSRCVHYVTGKEDARILASDGVLLTTTQDIIDSFEFQRQMNPRISKPVGHIALSFLPEDKDKLTDEMMTKIAREYMELMGIKDTQFLLVRHFDKPREETYSEPQKHNEPSIGIPSLGLIDTTNPVYDPAEEEFRRRMQKKKKKRGPRL